MKPENFSRLMLIPVLVVLTMISCRFMPEITSQPEPTIVQKKPTKPKLKATVIPTLAELITEDTATIPPAIEDTAVPTRQVVYYPSTSQTSAGPGTCGTGGITFDGNPDNVYDCTVVFSDNAFIELIITKNGQEIGRSDGVQDVFFSVKQIDNDGNERTFYTHTESNAPYCIFGGDDTCTPWILEDDVYKWEQGGVPLEAGTYTVSIIPNMIDPPINLFWSADITVTLP